eukprot:19068-Heterococcus_DN1.PRE.1
MRGAGGEVLHADVMTLPGGRSKGCGVVEYGEYVQQLEHVHSTLVCSHCAVADVSAVQAVLVHAQCKRRCSTDMSHIALIHSNVTRCSAVRVSQRLSYMTSTPEQAAAAIAQLHNTTLQGRPISVRIDRDSGTGTRQYTTHIQQPQQQQPQQQQQQLQHRQPQQQHRQPQQQQRGTATAASAAAARRRGGGSSDVACRVYVGNLSWDADWQASHFLQSLL